MFPYGDAQRYRLGINSSSDSDQYTMLSVAQLSSRRGAMRVDGNFGSMLGYEPNSNGEWPGSAGFYQTAVEFVEHAAAHCNCREDTDYYSQPGALFCLMTPAQQQALFENTHVLSKVCHGKFSFATSVIASKLILPMVQVLQKSWVFRWKFRDKIMRLYSLRV